MKTNLMTSRGAALGIVAASLMSLPAMAGGPSADTGAGFNGSSYYEQTQAGRLQLRDLPQSVRLAFHDRVGNVPIRVIVEQTRPEVAANEPIYKIELAEGAGPAYPTVWISARGDIIKEVNMNANMFLNRPPY
jgi:hypothetical protein